MAEYDITIRISSNHATEEEVLKIFEDYWDKSAIRHPLFEGNSCVVSLRVDEVTDKVEQSTTARNPCE